MTWLLRFLRGHEIKSYFISRATLATAIAPIPYPALYITDLCAVSYVGTVYGLVPYMWTVVTFE